MLDLGRILVPYALVSDFKGRIALHPTYQSTPIDSASPINPVACLWPERPWTSREDRIHNFLLIKIMIDVFSSLAIHLTTDTK